MRLCCDDIQPIPRIGLFQDRHSRSCRAEFASLQRRAAAGLQIKKGRSFLRPLSSESGAFATLAATTAIAGAAALHATTAVLALAALGLPLAALFIVTSGRAAVRMTLAAITPEGRSVARDATEALHEIRFGTEPLSDEALAAMTEILREARAGAGDFDADAPR